MVKVGLHIAIPPGFDKTWSYLPPLSFGYLAAYARARLGGVEFIVERDVERLIAARPDIVGISYATHTARHAVRQARMVKEALGCPVLAGGPHVSTLPSALDPAFDVAVLGEGEETFTELLALYQAEGRFDPHSLRKVKGILFRDADGCLTRTETRPFIQNLDQIPYPDRDLHYEQWRQPKAEVQLLTSRGCPYNCAFCSTIVHWGHKWRMASEEYVLGELELVRRKYSPELIHFYDDLFTVNRKRALKLMKGIRERGLHEGVEFDAFVRSNLLDDELMESFARTNFKVLHIGFESGSEAVLKAFNKQGTDMAKHRLAVELAQRHGIDYTSCFILGAPGETRQDILDTFEFVRQNAGAFRYVHFTPLMVFPGTKVWEWARQAGYSETNMTGIEVDVEDFTDGIDYLTHRWPYFNEKSIPREEMINYLRLGTMMEDLVGQLHTANQRAHSASFVAENVPIAEIMKQKARKRLAKLLPTGRP